jgi:NAD(P)-dependent dehydrogenase (short-subunit alcohol dehydrogenase family)
MQRRPAGFDGRDQGGERDGVVAVNVKSAFLMCREIIPVMTLVQGGGSIVNKFLAGAVAEECELRRIARLRRRRTDDQAMAIDHGGQNIRINSICPGDTDYCDVTQRSATIGRGGRSISR